MSFSLEEQKKRELFEASGFYEKLSNGFNVNILVIGDSIGAGHGAKELYIQDADHSDYL